MPLSKRADKIVQAVEPLKPGAPPHTGFLRGLKTFNSFGSAPFRFYYSGALGHQASMSMQQIANGLLLERLTGSPAILGIMSLANAIPTLALSLLGGVIADRIEKKILVLVGQASLVLLAIAVAIALGVGYLSPAHGGSWWILVVYSGLQGAIMGLAMPARAAMIFDIVSGDQLLNAISLNFMGMNALQLIAPLAAGFLIQDFDFKSVYYAMTAFFLLAVVLFAFVPRTGVKPAAGRSAVADVKKGLRYVWQDKKIRLVLFISFISIVLGSPWGLLAPFFVDDILHVGAEGLGVLMSVSGVGAILASVVLASLPNRNRGLMMLVGGLFLGMALCGFAASGLWPVSLILIALVGIGGTVNGTMANTLVQYHTEAAYQGRVMGLFNMQFGLASFGNFASGLIGQRFGVQWAVGGFALVLVLITALALIWMPRVRKLA